MVWYQDISILKNIGYEIPRVNKIIKKQFHAGSIVLLFLGLIKRFYITKTIPNKAHAKYLKTF